MYRLVSPLRNYLFWFPFPALCVIHQFLSVSISLSLSGDILRITKRASGLGLNCPKSEAGKVCRIRLGLYRRGWGEGKEGRTGSRLRICFFWLPLSLVICTFLVLLDKVLFGFSRGLRRDSTVLRFRFRASSFHVAIKVHWLIHLFLSPFKSFSLSLSLSCFIWVCLRICFAVALNYWRNLNTPNRKKSKCEPFMQGPHKWRNVDYRNSDSTATKTIKNCKNVVAPQIQIQFQLATTRCENVRIHKLQELH